MRVARCRLPMGDTGSARLVDGVRCGGHGGMEGGKRLHVRDIVVLARESRRKKSPKLLLARHASGWKKRDYCIACRTVENRSKARLRLPRNVEF